MHPEYRVKAGNAGILRFGHRSASLLTSGETGTAYSHVSLASDEPMDGIVWALERLIALSNIPRCRTLPEVIRHGLVGLNLEEEFTDSIRQIVPVGLPFVALKDLKDGLIVTRWVGSVERPAGRSDSLRPRSILTRAVSIHPGWFSKFNTTHRSRKSSLGWMEDEVIQGIENRSGALPTRN